MAVVWTKKAEKDYRERHPHRECTRIAGHVAYYEGQKITRAHTVFDGFVERGWIIDQCATKISRAEANKCTARFQGGLCTQTQREDRWRLMLDICKRMQIKSLTRLTIEMGFADCATLTKFCNKYGRDLAKKFGKLPKINGRLDKGVWLEIMEQN